LSKKNGIVWGTLTLEDRKAAGYSGSDDADLINIISAIDGFKVGMIFVEQSDHRVKISWRALEPGIDVSPIAKFFGAAATPRPQAPMSMERSKKFKRRLYVKLRKH